MGRLTALVAAALAAGCSASPAERPWTSESQTFALASSGPFVGVSGYARDRAQLSAAQLALLDRLELREPAPCALADGVSYQLTIVDALGAEHQYKANAFDMACDPAGAPVVAWESLQPFLATFECFSSGETWAQRDGGLVVLPGDGCRHGVFSDGRGTSTRVELPVAAAGTELTLETEAWATFASRVTLLDTDGTTVLGQGTEPPQRPGCSSLTHVFAAAGTYFVEVTNANAEVGTLHLRVE